MVTYRLGEEQAIVLEPVLELVAGIEVNAGVVSQVVIAST